MYTQETHNYHFSGKARKQVSMDTLDNDHNFSFVLKNNKSCLKKNRLLLLAKHIIQFYFLQSVSTGHVTIFGSIVRRTRPKFTCNINKTNMEHRKTVDGFLLEK